MVAVATATIGGAGGTILSGETVVTGEESLNPVGGQIVFGVQLGGGVAFAANFLGDFQRRAAFEGLYFVFGVAIGADGGVAPPDRDRLAVDTFRHIFGFLFMALSAGPGEVGKIKRRTGRIGREDAVRAVAIGANRGMVEAGVGSIAMGHAMHACGITEGGFQMAARAIHGADGHVVVGMLARDVVVATGAGIGVMDGGGEQGAVRKEGDDAPGVGDGERFIAVAIQAIAVLDLGSRQGQDGEEPCRQG